jgi:hypothetical protein
MIDAAGNLPSPFPHHSVPSSYHPIPCSFYSFSLPLSFGHGRTLNYKIVTLPGESVTLNGSNGMRVHSGMFINNEFVPSVSGKKFDSAS